MTAAVCRIACTMTVAVGLLFTGTAAVADEELERRVQRLENILDGDQLVELIDQLSAVEQEMRELRGEIDEQSHRLRQLQQRQRNLYGDLDERVREIELAADRLATAPQTVEQELAEPATDAEGGEREAYQAAFNTLREGRYDAAAQAFSDFLDAFGDSEYAANARYWLGESYYVNRDFAAALENFERVLDEHGDSGKAPDALLKVGYTQYEMGDTDAARETLDRVREEYAGTSVARLAEERLVRIREEE